MNTNILYLHNPGLGDGGWLEKDRQMLLVLRNLLPADTWVVTRRQFGPPCGGYYYKLEFSSPIAETLKVRLAELGIRESAVAMLQFE